MFGKSVLREVADSSLLRTDIRREVLRTLEGQRDPDGILCDSLRNSGLFTSPVLVARLARLVNESEGSWKHVINCELARLEAQSQAVTRMLRRFLGELVPLIHQRGHGTIVLVCSEFIVVEWQSRATELRRAPLVCGQSPTWVGFQCRSGTLSQVKLDACLLLDPRVVDLLLEFFGDPGLVVAKYVGLWKEA